jgi:hypothetical protein
MGLLLDFLDVVLPGPEEASPPIQQNIPLFSEITLLIQIFKIPLLCRCLRRFSSLQLITQRHNCFIISAIWQHCCCQGGMDFVKSNSSPTVHTNSGNEILVVGTSGTCIKWKIFTNKGDHFELLSAGLTKCHYMNVSWSIIDFSLFSHCSLLFSIWSESFFMHVIMVPIFMWNHL